MKILKKKKSNFYNIKSEKRILKTNTRARVMKLFYKLPYMNQGNRNCRTIIIISNMGNNSQWSLKVKHSAKRNLTKKDLFMTGLEIENNKPRKVNF